MKEKTRIKTVKVSDKGQIALPLVIRDAAGIKRGDDLIILECGGKILLEKTEHISEKIKDDFKDVLRFSEQSLKEVWGNKEDDVWEDYL